MKNIIRLLLVIISIHANCFAQVSEWVWAKGAGGIYQDRSNGVATDTAGNVYITGAFNSSITFDSITLTGIGVYIVKYNSLGNVIWAKGIQDAYFEGEKNISIDINGNVYLTGKFYQSVIFNNDTLTGPQQEVFIAKYDTDGNVLWAKSAGGNSHDVGRGISSDSSGNIYVTGTFSNNNIIFDTDTLTNSGGEDIFIAKYSTNGNFLWVKKAGGIYSDKSHSISTDGFGNIFLIGNFSSPSIIFGSDTLTNVNGNIFIAKYNTDGKVLWTNNFGSSSDRGNSVTTDLSGNVYITGMFSDSIIFGNTTLINGGVFIAKFDSLGNSTWAQKSGSTSDEGTSIRADELGNIYLTGNFSSPSIIFGSDTLLNTGDSTDIFIAKYDTAGSILWGRDVGESNYEIGTSISPDAIGNIYLTGYYTGPFIIFGSDTLTNSGYENVFVSKLNICSATPPIITLSGLTTFCNGDSVTLTSSYAVSYLWSTGDTTSSIVVFNSGNYGVMITDSIGCSSSSIPVNATVNPLPIAAFTFLANKYAVSFTNNSSGAETYQWHFGDGNTSVQQNPVHLYTNAGTYAVLLKAYSDSGCIDIDTVMLTINTYDISGIVYKQVVSNVVSSGWVYLIEYNNGNSIMTTVDSVIIAADGTYQFDNVFLDAYLILAKPDRIGNPGHFDTYYKSSSTWNTATIFTLLSDTSNINIGVYQNSSTNGRGRISGQLVQGNIIRSGPGSPMTDVTISLVLRGSATPIKFNITDTTGNFSFDSIPTGNYYLWPDITGVPVDTTYGSTNSFSIKASDTAFDVIITVDSNLIHNTLTTTVEEFSTGKYTLQVYPNPFNTSATIELNENQEKVVIGMYNLIGREVSYQTFPAGHTLFNINRNNLPSGIYFIRLQAGEKDYNSKVIIE